MVGTARADRLVGTSRRDVIIAGAGDDVVLARGGRDVVCAKSGDDKVDVGGGADAVDGGAGDDAIDGGAGGDRLNGLRGDDRLAGREGDDVLVGGGGRDRLGGGPGNDRCLGGAGDDSLRSCESGGGGADETPPPDEPIPPSPPADQPPLAVNDTATVTEDAAATAIPVLANDTDPDAGPKSVAAATQPANGEVQITGGGSSLTYKPDLDYCNDPPGGAPDSFSYSLAPGASTATVSVKVTCANESPVTVTSGGSTTYTENAVAVPVDGALTVLDADNAQLASATVQISGSFRSGDQLGFAHQVGITGSYDSGTGVLTLTGTSSVASYQTALRSIKFEHIGDNPGTSRTVEFKVNDGDDESAAASKGISVTPVNDAPLASPSGDSVNEDGSLPVDLAALVADVETGDADLTYQIVTSPAHGNLTGSGGSRTYTPAADFNGSDSFAYRVMDRGDPDNCSAAPCDAPETSTTETVSITVNALNDAPKLQNIEAGALAYTESDPATDITSTTTVADVDSLNVDTGTLTVDYSVGGTADDRLAIRNQGTGPGQIGVSGSTVTFGGTAIGTFTGGTGTTPLVVTLNASATPAAAQALVRDVTYRNVSDSPSTATRTVRFVLTDGDGGTSSPATRNLTVNAVNAAPVITATAGSLSHTEGDGPEAIDTALTIADVDSPNLASATVQITGNYANGQDVLAAVAPLFGVAQSFDPSTGTLTLTGATTFANYQTILRAVTYENTSQAPSTIDRTVTFKVNDGGVDSNGATRGIVVTGVDDAPTVTTSAGSTPYTEQNPPVTVDSALVAADVDGGANPTGATVEILSTVAGDTLHFTNQNGITGNFASGVLTLSGTATLAQYEQALRSVGFSNATSDTPGTSRSIQFKITTPIASNTSTKTIAITEVNDPP